MRKYLLNLHHTNHLHGKGLKKGFFCFILLFTLLIYTASKANFEQISDVDIEIKQASLARKEIELNPTLISSIADLKLLRSETSNYNRHFKLTRNLSFTLSDYDDQTLGWLPIGNKTFKFTGSFDGNNYSISNLWINRTSQYLGLFGYNTGSITNLHLLNTTIIQSLDIVTIGVEYVGTLAGYSQGSIQGSSTVSVVTMNTAIGIGYVGGLVGESTGLISNCFSNMTIKINKTNKIGLVAVGGLVGENGGSISGSSTVSNLIINSASIILSGGLVGENFGSITNSYANTTISATTTGTITRIGGLVGHGGSIYDSSASAILMVTSINSSVDVGGLIGSGSSIYDSSANATIMVTTTNGNVDVGGLVGTSLTTKNSFANAIVTVTLINSDSAAGGLIGLSESNGFIDNSYAIANLTVSQMSTTGDSKSRIGGLVGYAQDNSVTNCYAIAQLMTFSTTSDLGSNSSTGGLIGYSTGTVSYVFAVSNAVTTGTAYSNLGGLIGENTGMVDNSFASSVVTSMATIRDEVGGLIGRNSGLVSNSYYDNTKSKTDDTDKGIPQTTIQIQTDTSHFLLWNMTVWRVGDVGFPSLHIAPNPIFTSSLENQAILEGSSTTLVWAAVSKNPTDYYVKIGSKVLCSGIWISGEEISCEISSDNLKRGSNVFLVRVSGQMNTFVIDYITIVVPTLPSSPTELTVTSSGKTASISWNVPTNNVGETALTYIVARSKEGGAFINITATHELNYLDTNLSRGSTYTYKVVAVNFAGTSNFTEPKSITIPFSEQTLITVPFTPPNSVTTSPTSSTISPSAPTLETTNISDTSFQLIIILLIIVLILMVSFIMGIIFFWIFYKRRVQNAKP